MQASGWTLKATRAQRSPRARPYPARSSPMRLQARPATARKAIEAAHTAFLAWRNVPAPKRGELVRLLGEELRANKEALGRLVSIEVGKILSEGLGEVQEMIDICDFAVGLSRQLHGLTIATERPEHRMMETWHPPRRHRHHLGLQLPRGRVVVERGAGPCRAAMPASGSRPRRRPSPPSPPRRCSSAQRGGSQADGGTVPQGLSSRHHRRARHGRGARRSSARAAGLGHRLDGDGPGHCAAARASDLRTPFWSSAATMPPSSALRPTSTWRSAPWPSPPWARRASAAPRCAACSCMRPSTRSFVAAPEEGLSARSRSAIRWRLARWSAR